MNDTVLLIGIALIAGFYFVKGGTTFIGRLIRATAVCILVGLLIAAWS
jgi:hypothetical protein